MKDGPLSKLTITDGGQRATQYKKILDTLPVFCADKGYKYIDDIIRTDTEKTISDFTPTYPLASQWSSTYHVEVNTVDPNGQLNTNGTRVIIKALQKRTNIHNPNLQKQLLSEHDMKSKLELQEWYKLTTDKKALMTIIYGQCDDATRTEISIGARYKDICDDAEIINFLALVQKVCFGSNDGGLSFKPHKITVAIKSIKYEAVLAVVGKFPNGTGSMLEVLKVETPPRDWDDYCTMDVADQVVWEK